MMTGRIVGIVLALVAFLGLESCNHRPLVDPVNTHYVRIYIDDNIKNVTTGHFNNDYVKPILKTPEVVRVLLCDPDNGDMKFERYLTHIGKDAKGTYLDGYIACEAGDYQMLAYNWDTETTLISQPNNCFAATAYTNVAMTKAETVHYAPDFLFVAESMLNVPNTKKLDTLYTPGGKYHEATSIVETYFIQVPIKGMDGVAEITAIVTGMVEDKKLIDRAIGEQPVSMMTSMSKGYIVADVMNVYTIMNTFGHYPGADSKIELIFYLTLVDGHTYVRDIDITEKFKQRDALDNNWIIIDEVIEAPKPEPGGGFRPGIDEWNDVTTEIPL